MKPSGRKLPDRSHSVRYGMTSSRCPRRRARCSTGRRRLISNGKAGPTYSMPMRGPRVSWKRPGSSRKHYHPCRPARYCPGEAYRPFPGGGAGSCRRTEASRPCHLRTRAADLFNAFYHYEPVLKSEGITRQSRLTLVKAAKNTLKDSLETLGIDALSTM